MIEISTALSSNLVDTSILVPGVLFITALVRMNRQSVVKHKSNTLFLLQNSIMFGLFATMTLVADACAYIGSEDEGALVAQWCLFTANILEGFAILTQDLICFQITRKTQAQAQI